MLALLSGPWATKYNTLFLFLRIKLKKFWRTFLCSSFALPGVHKLGYCNSFFP
jgi:hypothetical protein